MQEYLDFCYVCIRVLCIRSCFRSSLLGSLKVIFVKTHHQSICAF